MRKLSVSISLVLILLFLVGCGKTTSVVDPSAENTPETRPQISEKEFSLEEYKVVKIAAKMDLEACKDLKAPNLQILCMDDVNMNLAKTNKDDKYCDEIQDNTTKEECSLLVTSLSAQE